MALRTFKPTSPGRRHMTSVIEHLAPNSATPKSLLAKKVGTGGRNSHGWLTHWNTGGGHKQRYRLIDLKREKDGIPAKVESIHYDPNRTARIALVCYRDGERRFILAPEGLAIGQIVLSGTGADIIPGNCLPLGELPLGTMIHNIELQPGKGGQLVRSAGTVAQLVARDSKYAQVRLPSTEVRMVRIECRATVGQLGNSDHSNESLGKAGRSRWMGRRPHVRGVAKNPIDHPMGGGEGKSSGGRHPVTPWGVPTKGYKTVRRKPTSKYIVRARGKKS